MTKLPHWQLLMLIYFLLVAIPVFVVHAKMKTKVLGEKTFANLMIYLASVTVTAVIMHFVTMWLYFTFFFTVKN
jgi:hypothetical protein